MNPNSSVSFRETKECISFQRDSLLARVYRYPQPLARIEGREGDIWMFFGLGN